MRFCFHKVLSLDLCWPQLTLFSLWRSEVNWAQLTFDLHKKKQNNTNLAVNIITIQSKYDITPSCIFEILCWQGLQILTQSCWPQMTLTFTKDICSFFTAHNKKGQWHQSNKMKPFLKVSVSCPSSAQLHTVIITSGENEACCILCTVDTWYFPSESIYKNYFRKSLFNGAFVNSRSLHYGHNECQNTGEHRSGDESEIANHTVYFTGSGEISMHFPFQKNSLSLKVPFWLLEVIMFTGKASHTHSSSHIMGNSKASNFHWH